MRLELQAFDEVVVISLDLLAAGPDVLPVGFGRERELIHVRRYIAPKAGVAVPMPHATNVGAFFQNAEVGEAGLLEDMSGGDTRHAGADNHDSRIPLTGFRGGRRLVCLGHVGTPITGRQCVNPPLDEAVLVDFQRAVIVDRRCDPAVLAPGFGAPDRVPLRGITTFLTQGR
jgi:hypothetical protein